MQQRLTAEDIQRVNDVLARSLRLQRIQSIVLGVALAVEAAALIVVAFKL